ncbi:MAG: TrkH family potassium uptake protein [Gemmatimonadetes bacterium]|nr:TrkH family potassium uptake protein [Gemmatimonadota bacterium]
MSFARVFNVVGLLVAFTGVAMGLAAVVAWSMDDPDLVRLALAAVLTTLSGGLAFRVTRGASKDLSVREGYVIVTFGWVAMGLFGALPYLLTGTITDPAGAVFESVSGFTTTGATVLTGLDTLSPGILFWRSLTQWLGGMGIIVLAVAVLPFLGIGGMQLLQAEVPGLAPERLRPRVTQTAKLLWYVYLALTMVQALLYVAGGMDLFDAVNHAFTTMSTGGFSTRDASIGAFSSPYIQWVTVVFMYLAGINFVLHFRAVSPRQGLFWRAYGRDSEWRFYTRLLAAATILVVAVNGVGGEYGWSPEAVEALVRDAAFQVVSIMTSTGFANQDYSQWVPPAQMTLLLLMFVGGMAGSTAGGVKTVRVLLLLKHTAIQLKKHLHPRAVLAARLGNRPVKDDVLATVVGFVILYSILVMAGMLVMSLLGVDLMTSLGLSAATVGNIGPGLGPAGPAGNYAWISDPGLMVLSFLMIVGRLEMYTVLILFSREVWRRG